MKRTRMKRGRREPSRELGTDMRYWKITASRGGCVMCKAFPVPFEQRVGRLQDLERIDGHHVLAQRHLRTHGHHDRLWDTRNGMALCRYHHGRHESRMQPVPYELVPAGAIDFALEVDLDYIIEKEYPRG